MAEGVCLSHLGYRSLLPSPEVSTHYAGFQSGHSSIIQRVRQRRGVKIPAPPFARGLSPDCP